MELGVWHMGTPHDLLGREGIAGPQGCPDASPAASQLCLWTTWEVRREQLASLPLSLSPPTLPSTQTRQFYVSIQPPVGELMAPVFMSENEFKKEQGECSMWWAGRALRTSSGAHSAPPYGHAQGASVPADRGRPHSLWLQQKLHRGQDPSVRPWRELGLS